MIFIYFYSHYIEIHIYHIHPKYNAFPCNKTIVHTMYNFHDCFVYISVIYQNTASYTLIVSFSILPKTTAL